MAFAAMVALGKFGIVIPFPQRDVRLFQEKR